MAAPQASPVRVPISLTAAAQTPSKAAPIAAAQTSAAGSSGPNPTASQVDTTKASSAVHKPRLPIPFPQTVLQTMLTTVHLLAPKAFPREFMAFLAVLEILLTTEEMSWTAPETACSAPEIIPPKDQRSINKSSSFF